MAFPATPLDLTAELLIGGAWTAITTKVYRRGEIVISRGRTDEGQHVERSVCAAEINNRDGNFSPRNPTGIYYGLIGRNTPMRVRKAPASDGYLLLSGETGGISTPDSANLSITGDIDIRVDVQLDRVDLQQGLCCKWNGLIDDRAWNLRLNADRTLTFKWSANGVAVIAKSSTAAATIPASGRIALRVTLDVDNGAAGNDVKFYTATTIDGSWTQLGSTVTTGGVTSIFNNAAAVEVGTDSNVSESPFEVHDMLGRVYGFELYQGIAGTVRADVDLDDEEAGAASFADGQANTWTVAGDASIVDPAVRARGEVSEWPQRWDTSGTDIWVPIEASGVLRRLGQGDTPLGSALYRHITRNQVQPVAYWPCEDGQDATTIASGLDGGMAMTVVGAPDLAGHSDFKCSSPIPLLQDSEWTGRISTYSHGSWEQLQLLLAVPSGGAADGHGVVRLYFGSGTLAYLDLIYLTGGDIEVKIVDSDDNATTTTVSTANVNGLLLWVNLDLEQQGADVGWVLKLLQPGGTQLHASAGATRTSETLGRVRRVVVNPAGGLQDVAVGHVAVYNATKPFEVPSAELNAYSGEVAGRRIQRLCEEESVGFRGLGDQDATTAVGYQLPAKLIDLLREAADADGGVLYEPRDMFGLAYRTRESLYNQAATLTLDYAAGHLSGIEPVDDDQQTRNDVTVRRVDGSAARAVLSSGALSTLDPPDGVGTYDTEVSLSLAADSQLPDQAGWRLLLGTVDETRYPVLGVNLARAPFTNDAALYRAAEDLDIGGRLVVENPPAWVPPDDIAQLAQGFKETMANFEHTIDVNCSPSSPWDRVGVYLPTGATSGDRYSSDGSTLAEDLTSGETAVDVATGSGPLWSHADGDFAIRVGGEVMTVTAVAGASSPQTFTVTRSVNGVTKTHSTGAAVELDQPAVYAI
jgi:hypothetical protein